MPSTARDWHHRRRRRLSRSSFAGFEALRVWLAVAAAATAG